MGKESALIHVKPPYQAQQEISLHDINAMVTRGELNGEEPAWIAGLPEWTALRNIPGVVIHSAPLAPELFTTTDRPLPLQTAAETADPDAVAPSQPERPAKSGPSGVGGWLLLFCVAIVILGPLLTFSSLAVQWEVAKPSFESYPSLKLAIILENLGIATIAVGGIWVGVTVWRRRPNGKRYAQTYLVWRFIGFILLESIVLMLLETSLPAVGYAEFIRPMVQEGLFALVWWTYFKKSRRVRNTFGY